jgi:hypothetical protein
VDATAFLVPTERWLTVPQEATTKQFTGGCRSLADAGWEPTCERVRSQLGDAVWVHERKGVQERVLIYVNRGADGWDLALRAADDDGKEFDTTVQTVDLTEDGTKKILVKMRTLGEGLNEGVPDPPLQVDVVKPSGVIVVHLVISAGRSGHPDAQAVPL